MRAPKLSQLFTDKEARENFWYYYKGHIAVAAFVVLLLTMTIVDMVNNSQPVFQITYANIPTALQNTWTQHFNEHSPFGSDRKLVAESLILTDAIGVTEMEATVNRICAQVAAGEMDIFIADKETFEQFAVGELFEDWQLYLPENWIESNADVLFYSNIDNKQCITGLLWLHPTNGVTYVFAIPFSSTQKEPASTLILSLLQTEVAQ